jgi:hypothetical protein
MVPNPRGVPSFDPFDPEDGLLHPLGEISIWRIFPPFRFPSAVGLAPCVSCRFDALDPTVLPPGRTGESATQRTIVIFFDWVPV